MSFPGADHEREFPDQLDHRFFAQSMIDEGVARYKLAALLVPGKDVLDIACGSGYGPEIFSAAGANSVTAIDVDPQAIEYCIWHFKRTRVKYLVMDGRKLRFDIETTKPPYNTPSSFDVVVNHGSLQYLEPTGQHTMLEEIARVLRQDGVAMLSVNYNLYTGPDASGQHPHHIWAFHWPGLHELMFPHFTHVRVFVQVRALFTKSASGTSWIVVASNDAAAYERANDALARYVDGDRVVDLAPTWRDAV